MSEKINQVEPEITSEDIEEVSKYLNSGGWVTEHKITRSFEEKISEIVNRKYSVAVPNGTIAIYLSLIANGITKYCKNIISKSLRSKRSPKYRYTLINRLCYQQKKSNRIGIVI